MCYEIGHPLYPNGRRCAVSHAAVRRLGRRAQYFYGTGDAEARKKLSALPIEMQEGSTYQRSQLAMTSSDPEVIELALKDRPRVVAGLASNPSLTIAQAQALMPMLSTSARASMVLRNRDRPEIMAIMAEDTSAKVRGQVATAPGTPTAVLEKLTQDTSRGVASAAEGMLTPREDLPAFAESSSHPVSARIRVLRRRLGSEDTTILARIASNPSSSIRKFVAACTASREIRNELLFDKAEAVCDAAFRNYRVGEGFEDLSAEELVKSKSKSARISAIKNSTDPDFLTRMFDSPDETNARTAAQNEALPTEVIKERAHVSDFAAEALEWRTPENTPIEVRLRISEDRQRLAGTPEYPWEEAAKDLSPLVQRRVAAHRFETSPFEKWVSAENPEDRLKAFSHPGINREAVKKFLRDPDESVRVKAQQHFTPQSMADLEEYPELLPRMHRFKTADPVFAKALLDHPHPLAKIAGGRSIGKSAKDVLIQVAADHPEYILPMIKEDLLSEHWVKPEEIDRIFDQLAPWRQDEVIKYVRTPKLRGMLSRRRGVQDRRTAASDPLTPVADLKRLVKSKDEMTSMKAMTTLRRLAEAA